MSAFVANYQHFIWSTSERRPWIDEIWRPRLYEYIGGVARQRDAVLMAAGGTADHVHLLLSLPATISIAEIVNAIKSNSSRWIHETFVELAEFRWQTKYGAFSVSESQRPTIDGYIRKQEEHHRTRSYQEEFRLILAKHGLAIDERYAWE